MGRWAAYGLVFGLAYASLHLQYPWNGDAIRINLIDLFSMGIGYAIVAVFVAAIWNWFGTIKSN